MCLLAFHQALLELEAEGGPRRPRHAIRRKSRGADARNGRDGLRAVSCAARLELHHHRIPLSPRSSFPLRAVLPGVESVGLCHLPRKTDERSRASASEPSATCFRLTLKLCSGQSDEFLNSWESKQAPPAQLAKGRTKSNQAEQSFGYFTAVSESPRPESTALKCNFSKGTGRSPGSAGVAVELREFREYVLLRIASASAVQTAVRGFCFCSCLCFGRLRSGPFEGPATVKPPALPVDTYITLD